MVAVLVTGAAGGLGKKVALHFSQIGCDLILLDRDPRGSSDITEADLSVFDESWTGRFRGADIVVHLAGAAWPYRDWPALQRANVDALANVLDASMAGGVRRFVFASSLLTMEGYRDTDGPIRPDMPPCPMSFYAVTKLVGERLCLNASERHGLDVVCLRLGITRPGANLPSQRVGVWEQQKWLSNTDLCRAIELAAFAPRKGYVVVFVTSSNSGMRWSLDETRAAIGYEPQEYSTPVNPLLRNRIIVSAKRRLRRLCARVSGQPA